MSDAQDQSESLDDDVTSAEYPPEEPWGVDEPEVTQDGERARESFAERTDRLSEPDADADRPVIRPYVDPGQDIEDDESQAVAHSTPEDRSTALTGEKVPAPAEEAALHIEEG